MTSTNRSASLPILGQLSAIGRTMIVATAVVSVAAIVLDFGLHADGCESL